MLQRAKKRFKNVYSLIEQIDLDQGQTFTVTGDYGYGKSFFLNQIRRICIKKNILFIKLNINKSDSNKSFFIKFLNEIINNIEIVTPALEKNDLEFLNNYKQSQIFNSKKNKKNITQKKQPLRQEQIEQGSRYILKKIIDYKSTKSMVFIIDNLDYVNQEELETIVFALKNFENNKILIIYSSEKEIKDNFLYQSLNYENFTINKLSIEETTHFSKYITNVKKVSEKLIHKIYTVANGNILFTKLLIEHGLKNNHFSISDDQTLKIAQDSEVLPNDIEKLYQEKFNSLSQSEQKTCKVFNLFGNNEDLNIIQEFITIFIFDGSKVLSEKTIATLLEKKIIYLSSLFPNKKYKFHEDIFFQTVQKQISKVEFKKINLSLAKFLEHRAVIKNNFEYIKKISDHYYKANSYKKSISYSFKVALESFKNNDFYLCKKYCKRIFKHIILFNRDHISSFIEIFSHSTINTSSIDEAEKTVALLNELSNKEQKNIITDAHVLILLKRYAYKKIIQITNPLKLVNFSQQTSIPKSLPIRLKALSESSQLNIFIYESLLTLRKKNSSKNSELKIDILANILIKFSDTRKQKLSKNLVFLLSKISNNKNTSYNSVTRYHHSIQRYFEANKQYKLALRFLSTYIKYCKDNYLLLDYYWCQHLRGLTNAFLGNYYEAIKFYKISADGFLILGAKSKSFESYLFYIDALLDQGATIQAKKQYQSTLKIRGFEKNKVVEAVEYLVKGLLSFSEKNYINAANNFSISSKKYKNLSFLLQSIREKVRQVYCLLKSKDSKALKKAKSEYTKLFNWVKHHGKAGQDYFHIAMFAFYAQFPKDSKFQTFAEPDFKKIKNPHDQQWMYIAKIEYLIASNQKQQAGNLINEYSGIRDKIALNVHEKFQDDFKNHPNFKVPTLKD